MEDESAPGIVYWEKQQAAFCGVHAVNALLQSAVFCEADFGALAAELDAQERELLGAAARPQNRDVRGNYSIQVITAALRRVGLRALPLRGPEATAALGGASLESSAAGLLCHRSIASAHWFAMRRLGGGWFNLDSVFPGGPLRVSSAFLQRYLAAFQQGGGGSGSSGYSVYMVAGAFPRPVLEQPPGSQVAGRGLWFEAGATRHVDGSGRLTGGTRGLATAAERGAAVARAAVAADGAGDTPRARSLYAAAATYVAEAARQAPSAAERARLNEAAASYAARASRLGGAVGGAVGAAVGAAAPPPPAPGRPPWEWLDESGAAQEGALAWRPFGAAAAAELERAHASGEVALSLAPLGLAIDLREMHQTEVATGRSRPIRRRGGGAAGAGAAAVTAAAAAPAAAAGAGSGVACPLSLSVDDEDALIDAFDS